MSIEHIWNGTVLTVISDSGASSADLKGQKGDTGPRGPQGPAGVILNEQGQIVVDLSPYYTGAEVDEKIAAAVVNVDLENYPTEAEMATYVSSALGPYATKNDLGEVNVDLTGYATETYVNTEVAKAQLEGAGVDTSVFATKEDLAAIGGYETANVVLDSYSADWVHTPSIQGQVEYMGEYRLDNNYTAIKRDFMPVDYIKCSVKTIFKDGTEVIEEFLVDNDSDDTLITLSNNGNYIYFGKTLGKQYIYYKRTDGNYTNIERLIVYDGISLFKPINANAIPVDGVTTKIENGKLVALASGEVNLTNYYTKSETDNLIASYITAGTTDLTAGVSTLASGTLYFVFE